MRKKGKIIMNILMKYHNPAQETKGYIVIEETFIQVLKELNPHLIYTAYKQKEMPFSELPDEVQNEIRSELECFNEVTVTFENGKFKCSSSIIVRKKYPVDFFVVGYWKTDDIFSKEEQRTNFLKNFGYIPHYLK